METIRGKTSHKITASDLYERIAGYQYILLDLGTGDGRFARCMAEQKPDWFVVGLDACRENLQSNSQTRLHNLLFVVASAQALPTELVGLAAHITINFPWGSLLGSLLENDSALMNGLVTVAGSGAMCDVRLNGGALSEVGVCLETGAERIHSNLRRAGWKVKSPVRLDAQSLRAFPSTWAKRLAFGRDPRAMGLHGKLA